MDGLEWKSLLKWVIWGYHYFRTPPTPLVGPYFWFALPHQRCRLPSNFACDVCWPSMPQSCWLALQGVANQLCYVSWCDRMWILKPALGIGRNEFFLDLGCWKPTWLGGFWKVIILVFLDGFWLKPSWARKSAKSINICNHAVSLAGS